ncbi:hypothetical protein GCM10009756_21080 [Pseudokineococcus marinus]
MAGGAQRGAEDGADPPAADDAHAQPARARGGVGSPGRSRPPDGRATGRRITGEGGSGGRLDHAADPRTRRRGVPGVGRVDAYCRRVGRHERVAALAGEDLAGLEVADLGCGPGRTVRALLAAGPRRVHALDRTSGLDDDVLADARVRSRLADLDEGVPLADGSLDAAVSLNVVEHLASPVDHLVDCHRALAPGGRLVLAHSDWDTALFTSSDDGLTRALVDRFVAAAHGPAPRSDGFMGRKLLGLSDASGACGAPWEVEGVEVWADGHRRFDDGSVAWKVATAVLAAAGDEPALAARAAGWVEDLRALADAGQFLFAVTDVAVVLRRA